MMKLFRAPAKWFGNRRFIVKLLLVYILCGAIPMAFILGYNYINTVKLLQEQSDANMRQDVSSMENSLEAILQPYQMMVENLKNDKNLNTLLSLDYSSMSYSDLAYYTKNNLDNMIALYPSIDRIRFFSSNDTLPEDDYYFYPLSDLDEQIRSSSSSETISTVYVNDDDSLDIILISRMNYFSSDEIVNYISISLNTDFIAEQIGSEIDSRRIYLLDYNGIIVSSSDTSMIGSAISDTLPEWDTLQAGQIQTVYDAQNVLLLADVAELDMGMTLLITQDEGSLYTTARIAPFRILFAFLLFSLLLLIPAVMYSRNMSRQLSKIITATEKIGAGDFNWEIHSETRDEFGQITEAVNQMNRRIDELIRDNYQKQLQAKNNELNLLQEQINPHFLYNALAVISSMAMRESAKQTNLSARYLADFYRISLNKGRQVIHIGEEVELLRNFMKIQMIRFSDILDITYEIDPEIEKYYTIKLLLQPLVENSIKHGREEDGFLHIIVRGREQNGRIHFDVSDDGIGIDAVTLRRLRAELQNQEEGFGLKNIDRRIKLAYGDAYGVSIESEPGQGTRVHVEIPLCETK